MKEFEASIQFIEAINDDYQHLELALEQDFEQLKPGQSLLVRKDNTFYPYLNERWWAVDIRKGNLIIERPIDEVYEIGQFMKVLGPVGQPFRFRRTLRNVMLIAYDTQPTPLLMTLPWLSANRISVTLVLVGNAAEYDTTHLPPEVEVVVGDEDFNWSDQVMTVGWADQVFVTVNQDDELVRFYKVLARFSERRADIPKNYLFGVFQPKLICGSGACHSCVLRTQQSNSLICLDGPAYDLTQVKLV